MRASPFQEGNDAGVAKMERWAGSKRRRRKQRIRGWVYLWIGERRGFNNGLDDAVGTRWKGTTEQLQHPQKVSLELLTIRLLHLDVGILPIFGELSTGDEEDEHSENQVTKEEEKEIPTPRQ